MSTAFTHYDETPHRAHARTALLVDANSG